jgi:hypothetical protein
LPKGKIADVTSYNAEFTQHDLAEAQGILPDGFADATVPNNAEAGRKRAKFAGNTQYNDTYQGEALAPGQQLQDLPTLPKAKFDARTTAGTSFQGK